MNLRALMMTVALVTGGMTPAAAQFPDPARCTATSAEGHIFISPIGGHQSLADAGLTIAVQIFDSSMVPLAGVAPGRITLDSVNPADLSECAGDRIADAATDANGMTTFSGVLAGGGFTQGGLQVYVDGAAVGTPPLLIEVNSSDLDGDLDSDITDLAAFAAEYFSGPFSFRADLWRDGVRDIADLSVFATHFSTACVQ